MKENLISANQYFQTQDTSSVTNFMVHHSKCTCPEESEALGRLLAFSAGIGHFVGVPWYSILRTWTNETTMYSTESKPFSRRCSILKYKKAYVAYNKKKMIHARIHGLKFKLLSALIKEPVMPTLSISSHSAKRSKGKIISLFQSTEKLEQVFCVLAEKGLVHKTSQYDTLYFFPTQILMAQLRA